MIVSIPLQSHYSYPLCEATDIIYLRFDDAHVITYLQTKCNHSNTPYIQRQFQSLLIPYWESGIIFNIFIDQYPIFDVISDNLCW